MNKVLISLSMCAFLNILQASPPLDVRQNRVTGQELIAFRVAALSFFGKATLGECDLLLVNYDVLFQESDSTILVTFVKPKVDEGKYSGNKQVAQEELRKVFGREATTVVIDRSNLKVLRSFINK
jgi:hypothetical protein